MSHKIKMNGYTFRGYNSTIFFFFSCLPFQRGSTLKGKKLEQILSFKNRPLAGGVSSLQENKQVTKVASLHRNSKEKIEVYPCILKRV